MSSSIPSSANQEDHVSMGTIGARKARDILENARTVVAMELMAACQAIDLRENKELGEGTKLLYNEVRKTTHMIEEDLVMYEEINKFVEFIKENKIINEIEKIINN